MTHFWSKILFKECSFPIKERLQNPAAGWPVYAVAIVLNNDSRTEPLVNHQLSFEVAPDILYFNVYFLWFLCFGHVCTQAIHASVKQQKHHPSASWPITGSCCDPHWCVGERVCLQGTRKKHEKPTKQEKCTRKKHEKPTKQEKINSWIHYNFCAYLFIYFFNLQTAQLLDLGVTTVDTAQSPATPPEGVIGELQEMDERDEKVGPIWMKTALFFFFFWNWKFPN